MRKTIDGRQSEESSARRMVATVDGLVLRHAEVREKLLAGSGKKRAVVVCTTAQHPCASQLRQSAMNYLPAPLAIVINGLVSSSFFTFFKGFLAMCFLPIRDASSEA
jgi:hypothetical protein